jgi:hypothetical protein
MTAIQKKSPAAVAPKAAPKPAPKPATKPADNFPMPSFNDEFFNRKAPSPEAIKKAKETIAALASVPGIPLSNKAKTPWLADAKAKKAEADKALDVLRDAEWEKKLPAAEMDAARDAVYKFDEKIESCEVRGGLKPWGAPLNPFRPLFQMTNNLGNVPNNVFGGLIAAFGVMIAIPVDIVDAVTRPIQAVLWPVAQVARGLHWVGNQVGIG